MPDSDSLTVANTEFVAGASPEDLGSRQEPHPYAQRQAAILRFAHRLVLGSDINSVMRDAASLIAESLKVDTSGVVTISVDGSRLKLTIVASTERDAREGHSQTYSRDATLSLAGFAIDAAQPTISTDLARESRFADDFLLKSGIASAFAVPLYAGPHAFGALEFFSTEHRVFSEDEVRFAETVAHLLASTLARMRTEAELKESRDLLDAVTETVEACVLVLDAEGRIVGANRTSVAWGGYPFDELAKRPFWDVFIRPNEQDMVQSILRDIRSGTPPPRFRSWFRSKDGQERSISWSPTVLRDASGGIASIVLTGMEINGRSAAETKKTGDDGRQHLRFDYDRGDAADPTASLRPFQRIPHKPAAEELRAYPRRAYSFLQMIAPMVDGKMPEENDFREVPFFDISTGGVSFLVEEMPDFKDVMIRLGPEGRTFQIVARVVHVQRVTTDGKNRVKVGCHFTDRFD